MCFRSASELRVMNVKNVTAYSGVTPFQIDTNLSKSVPISHQRRSKALKSSHQNHRCVEEFGTNRANKSSFHIGDFIYRGDFHIPLHIYIFPRV